MLGVRRESSDNLCGACAPAQVRKPAGTAAPGWDHDRMPLVIDATDDPRTAFARCRSFLEARPVEHNVALSILHERIAAPLAGRYWWALEHGEVTGYAFCSPLGFYAGLSLMAPTTVVALAEQMAADAPELAGVTGEAGVAATFAGRWTELLATGAAPAEGQRTYRLDAVTPADPPPGSMRPATGADRAMILRWMAGYFDDVGAGHAAVEVEDMVDRRIGDGWIWLWDDGGPAAMTTSIAPVAGAVRIGFVYTPPERRRHGYAQALVAQLSQQALDRGADVCLLYTQLHNPSSNAIYRRVGYRAVGEGTRYRFLTT